jgi:hypothetical protein
MTEERKILIENMQRVIDVNPRKEIFAALLANVAEDYYAEKIKKLNITAVSNSDLDEPFGYATTAELMLMFGKSVDEALDIHNDLEKLVNGDDV